MRAPTAPAAEPRLALRDVATASLCVGRGELVASRIETPTFRAVIPGNGGDAASIKFVVRGDTATKRALASGSNRRQLGLKLRAKDGCNLVYVMWRLDPKPKIEVEVKHNPGARTHRDCGARGYTRLEPAAVAALPRLDHGVEHELRAEIAGDEIVAWIDERVVWRGPLPEAAHDLTGPVGLRSDNLAFDLVAVRVDARSGRDVDTQCRAVDGE